MNPSHYKNDSLNYTTIQTAHAGFEGDQHYFSISGEIASKLGGGELYFVALLTSYLDAYGFSRGTDLLSKTR